VTNAGVDYSLLQRTPQSVERTCQRRGHLPGNIFDARNASERFGIRRNGFSGEKVNRSSALMDANGVGTGEQRRWRTRKACG
jgi:hypothetical protein